MNLKAAALLGVTAMAIAGCVPPNARRDGDRTPLKPVARLDCPADKGGLHRVSAATDGLSCAYLTEDGQTQVELRLLKVADTPEAALEPIETDIKALIPEATTPPEPAPPPSDAAPREHQGRDVDIQLPGLSIHAGEDQANVRVGGMHIKADGQGDAVKVTGSHPGGGRLSIDANESGAIIRTRATGPNVRSTFMVASDQVGPSGWRAAGYDAMGPRSGPLVVAVVKTKSQDRDDVFGAVRGLVRPPAGG